MSDLTPKQQQLMGAWGAIHKGAGEALEWIEQVRGNAASVEADSAPPACPVFAVGVHFGTEGAVEAGYAPACKGVRAPVCPVAGPSARQPVR